MAKFLADENMPRFVVELLRSNGHDVAWIGELAPGANDQDVLQRSLSDQRVLITLDKDFGELAFRSGKRCSCGVILLRPKLTSPDAFARFVIALLASTIDWENHFSVAQEGRVRVVDLPA
jgi:predicted nuclease of predicted toxin-antitoxin system